MWICRKCGEQNSDSSTFCLACGEKADDAQVRKATAGKEKDAEIIRQQAAWMEQQRQEQQRIAAEQQKIAAEQQREQQMAQELQQREMDYFLKENGHTGYYEYKVLLVDDGRGGGTNAQEIGNMLNYLGRNGWHLRCAYTNELGTNSGSVGVGGFSAGINSTVDQHVLIMERFLRFKL